MLLSETLFIELMKIEPFIILNGLVCCHFLLPFTLSCKIDLFMVSYFSSLPLLFYLNANWKEQPHVTGNNL